MSEKKPLLPVVSSFFLRELFSHIVTGSVLYGMNRNIELVRAMTFAEFANQWLQDCFASANQLWSESYGLGNHGNYQYKIDGELLVVNYVETHGNTTHQLFESIPLIGNPKITLRILDGRTETWAFRDVQTHLRRQLAKTHQVA